MADRAENSVLILDMVDLLGGNELLFVHDLHTGIFVCAFLFDEFDFSKGSLAQDSQIVIVFNGDLLSLRFLYFLLHYIFRSYRNHFFYYLNNQNKIK